VIAITGCGVVSAAGVGLDRLKELLDGRLVPRPAAEEAESYPPMAVRMAPELELSDYVPRKGTRRLDRMAGLAVITSKLALESAGRAGDDGLRARTGVTVGTSTGSVRSTSEIAAETLGQDEPYNISPSRFPNTVLNSCAGQIAIWNSLKGVNATLAGGHASSASAIRYGCNAIRQGQADSMLVGGIEEMSPQLAWAWHGSGQLTERAALGEGCALLVAERPDIVGDRPVLADLLAAQTGHRDPRDGLARGLAAIITRVLDRGGVRAEQIDVVSLGAGAQLGARRIEEQGVRLALGFDAELVRPSDVLGECYSAGGALQAAALLARWSGGEHPAERHALVTSLGRDGGVGCFLLRRP
jgi:3-oxoacyl-[acyl-carrier-protein] synthase II